MDQCPNCDYSLLGLPDTHHCPECGFEYTKDSQVFRQSKKWALTGVIIIAAFTCEIAVRLLMGGRFLRPGPDVYVSAVALAGSFWMLFYCVRRWRRRCNLVLWREGLIIIGRRAEPERFFWRDVVRFEYPTLVHGSARLFGTGDVTLCEITYGFCGGKRPLGEFVEAMKTRHRRFLDGRDTRGEEDKE